MEIKKTPTQIYKEFEDGEEYNSNRELYETVEKNQRFFIGNQWEGVSAPNLMKPVFNLVKRVVSYFVAMLVTDDVAVHITPFDDSAAEKAKADIISRTADEIIEKVGLKSKSRFSVKNCCVDGDTATYVYFDPDKETGFTYKGDLETETIDNVNIIFGNPYSLDKEKQPYILVIQRLFTEQVKDYAKEMGVSDSDIESITPDDDEYFNVDGSKQDHLTTVITKFWKEKKSETKTDKFGIEYEETKETVHVIKTTRSVLLKKDTDLGYSRYPISYMTWEPEKQSYHGRSPITGMIPNQIFINKMFAMCMVYLTNMGFPKVLFDSNKLKSYTNDVSKAAGVANIDLMGKVIDAAKAPDFSNQVTQLIDLTIKYTKDFMGASDAALGNVNNPNNTSAIVAVQQASAVPLEIQRLEYYDYIEEQVRAIIDIMANDYGVRNVKITDEEAEALGAMQPELDPMGQPMMDENGQPRMKTVNVIPFDFSMIKNYNYKLNVEIGQSTYWSETMQIQTMDNLFSKGIITDATDYLNSIPDKYIPNKQKLIDNLKEKQAQQQAMEQAAQAAQMQNQAPAQQGQGNPGEPLITPPGKREQPNTDIPVPTAFQQ